ncbi:MAG: T9SS C-terminal target domain-containing protein [Bacteroidia bacterium]|nr:MAG: T9SS C-terminal target domain-containing protein [Bacteroidia bacterium]
MLRCRASFAIVVQINACMSHKHIILISKPSMLDPDLRKLKRSEHTNEKIFYVYLYPMIFKTSITNPFVRLFLFCYIWLIFFSVNISIAQPESLCPPARAKPQPYLYSGSVEVVNGYRVIRGERPPINFSKQDADIWHEGVIIIKIAEEYARQLEENPPATREGTVLFGLPPVDSLNLRFGVSSAALYFCSPALNNMFTERQKAWGFHRWYLLEADPGTDILQMMDSYLALPEIEQATPSFHKVLTGLPPNTKMPQKLFAGLTSDGDSIWTPNDPLFSNQWSFNNTGQHDGLPGADISMPEAWAIEKGDTTVIVAVIDTGIDFTHEDLSGNMWYGLGYNFVHDTPVIEPGNHGTLVAGIVGAVNNNDTGVAGIAGGSGNSDGIRMMSAQVFAASGTGGFHIAPLYAADHGAAISQNSWGYGEPGYYNPAVLDAIDYFNVHGGGNVMEGGISITSAGNSNSGEPFYPGYYSGMFSVTGTNNQDQKAWYSNYGEYIDIAAPGGETNVVTEQGVLTTFLDNTYGYSQGTSVACPHASGVAALLVSYAYRNNHILTKREVWDFLVENTDNIDHLNPGYIQLLGSGRLNAKKVLDAAANTLGDVPNPGYFIASAVDDESIELSWVPNHDNNDVMILWSPEEIFGSPQDGTSYSPGDEIPGGGIVLYQGDVPEFIHPELEENSMYYYKAFSVTENHHYSRGRTSGARTYGPNLEVRGLNKDYRSIPAMQLPPYIPLMAKVKNTGFDLKNETFLYFSVPETGYLVISETIAPLPGGDSVTVVAEPHWNTENLDYGTYQLIYESDHEGSPDETKTDQFELTVSETLYARDTGIVANGVGSNSSPIILGMMYEIHAAADIFAVQIQWPDMALPELDFRLAVYEINENREIISTVFVSDLLTRTPAMQNSTHDFEVPPATLQPGVYMLAFKQLTETNLTVGFDNVPWGALYRSDNTVNPTSFPHRHTNFGNLALRMLLQETDTQTHTVVPEQTPLPEVWLHERTLHVNNTLSQMVITLYDMHGTMRKQFNVSAGKHTFLLSQPAGVYIVRLSGMAYIHSQKLIIR